MRFALSLMALPFFVSCGEDQAPGEESDADTDADSDTDTDTDADTDVSDAGDDIASAATIAYTDGKTPAASDAIGEAGDRDFFALSMKAGETVMAYTRAYAIDEEVGNPDTVLRVLDAQGNLLSENDDMPTRLEETDSAVYFQAFDNGTYYLEVLEWSDWDPTSDGPEGGSTWTYDLYADPLGVQDEEPNDTMSDADALFDKYKGALLYGNYIDPENTYALDFYGVTNSPKDVDMWRIDIADDPGFLTLVLYPGSRSWADLEVSMYDDAGNLVAQTDSPEFTIEHRIAFEDAAIIHWAQPGTYYFAVQDLKATTGTTYAGMFLSYLESNSEFEAENNDVVLAGNPISMDNSNSNFPDNYYGTMTGMVGAGGDNIDCYSVSASDVGGSMDGSYLTARTQAVEVGSLLDPEITIYGDDGTTVLASETNNPESGSPDGGVIDLELSDEDAVYICIEAQSADSFPEANQYEMAIITAPDPVF